jgi:type I restriction enzyme, S subunit
MEATINQPALKIDKSDWTLVKFGDVVAEPKETCKDIVAEGIEHVVGLEHIDTGDLHLRKSATTEESTTFSKKFKRGDVLFGRRRAYLKKAAQAGFDGICSGDITVFRAKKDLLPALLPFIVNNDKFFDFAVKHSAGGLSPRVKFKDLSNYQFLLPPKAEQARLAELLWAMDEVIEKEKEVLAQAEFLFKAKAKFISENRQKVDELKRVKEICLIKDNFRRPLNSSQRDKMKGNIPYYGANGVVDYLNDFIFNEELVLLAEDGGNFNEFSTKEIAYRVSGKSWVNNHAHVLAVKCDKIPIDWIFYSLVHKNIKKYIIGTTRLKLNKSQLESIEIWVPSKEIVDKTIVEMKSIDLVRKNSKSKISASQSLQKSLINQIF